MIEAIRQGLLVDGFNVLIRKLWRWLGTPRRTFYYKPNRSARIVQECFDSPIKAMIEKNPSF